MVPGAEARGLVAPRMAKNARVSNTDASNFTCPTKEGPTETREHKVDRRGVRTATSLDGITALPDHGDDGAAEHVYLQMLVSADSTEEGSQMGTYS